MRAFISLNLDANEKKKTLNIQNEVKNIIGTKSVDFIKWEGKDKFHQTLLFLGDINEKQLNSISNNLEIIKKEINFTDINFLATGINAFPNLRYPRVIFIELYNEDKKVFILYDLICKALANGGFRADKKFHPHITLGRVRRDKKINLTDIKDKLNFDLNLSANAFYLMESKLDYRGSTYGEIKKFEF